MTEWFYTFLFALYSLGLLRTLAMTSEERNSHPKPNTQITLFLFGFNLNKRTFVRL